MKVMPHRVAAVSGRIVFCPNIWLAIVGSVKLILSIFIQWFSTPGQFNIQNSA
jgi:hypothetical protein